MTSPISLPLVTWQSFCNPTVTCTVYSNSTLYTGQKDGHIWAYSLKDCFTLKHKMLLVGHKKAVVAMFITQMNIESSSLTEVLLSASEDGEIIRWNASDGKCQAVNYNGFLGIPRSIKVFPELSTQDVFCCGQANEISILNILTLEVVRVWGGHSSWVACMDFDDTNGASSPKLMTIDMEGGLDIWEFETKNHVVRKIQSISHRILRDAACFLTLGLLRSSSSPRLFMVLTSKNILVAKQSSATLFL
ncbi:WD40-repeat-containing domain protein [Sporodiniella umbellata]|nr:WD40-repeat-containing domain protein [Sporodiniella umbellata]